MKRRNKKSLPPARVVELEAGRIGARGDAVAEGPVYVPGLLPGERALVEVRGDRGRVKERLSDSEDRVKPFCPIAERCGGCSLQHWSADAYRTWKRSLVVDALAREGVTGEVAPLLHAHGEGRRRATLHARRAGRTLTFGYSERAGHAIVDTKDCPVAHPLIRRSFPALRRLADALVPQKGQVDISVTATDGGLDVSCDWPGDIVLDHRLTAAELAAKEGWARISLKGEPAAERSTPYVRFGKAKVAPPPGGFLQATAAGEAGLAERAMAAIKGARTVADLYAGCGSFALRAAETAQVLAVEGDDRPLRALRQGADHTQGLKPVQTLHRDLALEPMSVKELEQIDAVILDPPRNGARTQAERLADSLVPVVVSISCNPATFARDAAILIEGGYRMGEVTPVDQFAWTGHLESIAVFTRTHHKLS